MATRGMICVHFLTLFALVTVIPAQVPYNRLQFWQTSEPNMYSTGMIWRDCNNDGSIDVFYSNGNDIVMAENTIYISDNGTLPPSASWSSDNPEYSGHCAVGDINDDGWPDFAVANFLGSGRFATPNHSNLYLNTNGIISSSPDWYTGDSIYAFSCAFGDADGDGDLDLAVATGEPYNDVTITDRVYYNVGGVLQSLPGWQTVAATQALDVTWGDVDNDGDLDLAFCYDDRPPALYLNHDGQLDSFPAWQAVENESANTIIFGDIDGDGWRDLIVAFNYQLGGYGYYRAYYNDGGGNLGSSAGWQSGDGGYGSAVALYDYDNDGDLDLAAGRWFDRSRIYENTGSAFALFPQWRADPTTVVEEMAFVDVDGDGVEMRADTFHDLFGRKVFYTRYEPLYSVDSVLADGLWLGHGEYCYDLVSGWVALAVVPVDSLTIFYQYSFKNDLAISNWDTYNMVFEDTIQPYISFAADTAFGFVPLAVQFTDNSRPASQWIWRFGDGGTSVSQNPLHTYSEGGVYDVYLAAELADDWHNHTDRRMIITLADTLIFPELEFDPGDTVKFPVYLANAHPLDYFVVTISYVGSLDLTFVRFDTDSCRTGDFDDIAVIADDPVTNEIALAFTPGVGSGRPPLEPGRGRIVNLYFGPPLSAGAVVFDTATVDGIGLVLDADYISYQPRVIPGATAVGYTCGEANGDGLINLGDAIFVVNYVFRNGPAPDPLEAGDANNDGNVDVADAVYLITYIFKKGPAPCSR